MRARGWRPVELLIAVALGVIVLLATPGPAMAALIALAALALCAVTVAFDRRAVRRRSRRRAQRARRRRDRGTMRS
ncbi:MAG TPA: hypothetical protein VKV27_11790 [Solirubrobacteraceae bacterium]|nr:hypothetical protein [Solirubrobacteraceae bacterium]